MRRVLALLGAVAMVAAAVVVRAGIDGGAGGATGVGGADDPSTVVCDAALDAVCEALREDATVTVEAAGDTFERLARLADAEASAPGGAPDAWVTLAPWPAMVDEARGRSGMQPLFAATDGPAAGSSPLVLLAWSQRAEALRDQCGGGGLRWSCVAPVAGQPWADLGGQATWGRLEPGFDDPSRSSVGLAVLAQATAEELGTLAFGTRSLTDAAYTDWLRQLGSAVPGFRPAAGSVLVAMLQQGAASYDLVGVTEVAARSALASRSADDLVVHYPDPLVTADVVVATRPPVDGGELGDAVAAALGDGGWHTAGAAPEALGGGELPTPLPAATPGGTLPGAGPLTALRSTFVDVVRP